MIVSGRFVNYLTVSSSATKSFETHASGICLRLHLNRHLGGLISNQLDFHLAFIRWSCVVADMVVLVNHGDRIPDGRIWKSSGQSR
jgi:hypothetical protein